MRPHRLTHRSIHGVCALGAIAAILLVLAVTASARPIDTAGPQLRPHGSGTTIYETVVRPGGGGPDTIAWVLMAVATGAALIGAGYLGARIAIRTTNVRPS
jgi:hypothetical protein